MTEQGLFVYKVTTSNSFQFLVELGIKFSDWDGVIQLNLHVNKGCGQNGLQPFLIFYNKLVPSRNLMKYAVANYLIKRGEKVKSVYTELCDYTHKKISLSEIPDNIKKLKGYKKREEFIRVKDGAGILKFVHLGQIYGSFFNKINSYEKDNSVYLYFYNQ